MKLLSKPELKSKLHKQNEDLIETNVRLRKIHQELLTGINSVKKANDKDKELQDFSKFCEELNQKKSKLLKEYKDLEENIESKKEILLGLVEKQDELIEKEYQLKERENKLDLREAFIKNVESKIYELR